MQVQKPAPVNTVATMSPEDPSVLRRDLNKLRSDLDDLRKQLDGVKQSLSQIDAPRCTDPSTSSSKRGSRDCGPFACDQATGSCISSCNSTNDCKPGAICDTSNGRCVVPR